MLGAPLLSSFTSRKFPFVILFGGVLMGLVGTTALYASRTDASERQPIWLWSILQPDRAVVRILNDTGGDVDVSVCTTRQCTSNSQGVALPPSQEWSWQFPRNAVVYLFVTTAPDENGNFTRIGCLEATPPADVKVSTEHACPAP